MKNHWHYISVYVFIVNFKHVQHMNLILLLNLSIYPAKICLFKVATGTLEKGAKYVQS